MTKCISICK